MTERRNGLARFRQDCEAAWRQQPRLVPAVMAAFISIAVVPAAAGLWFLGSLWSGLPEKEAVDRIGEMAQATAVYDVRDNLAFTIFKEQRIEVPIEEISPHLIRAILAIEDQRFYEHDGFDVIRIASAALTNIRHGRVLQGGSTITQQLARQSFLTPARTFRRKVQELILAARIERLFSKERILELYLNKVYFGDGLYGVEAAARGYFDKRAMDVNVAEAALLVGLVKSPSTYAPTVSREQATARRNLVLQAMLESGALDRATWQRARAERVKLKDGLRVGEPYGQYFKEEVRRELVERFGWERVYQGGLRVFSTIDMDMQKAAEAAVAGALKALDRRSKARAARAMTGDAEPLQAALVAMNPKTGHVYAMIGGRDFTTSPFNRAVQAHRQAGSAFKPFVYAAALEAGFSPSSVIRNLNDPIPAVGGAWTPEDDHSTAESMTLRTALRTSSNRAAVRLLQEIGVPWTVRYAKTMGVGDVPAVPSLALGSGEVTLQAMTAAFAAFAGHGLVPQPLLIRRVEDHDGVVLYTARESATRAISETTAFLMADMLAGVIDAGTAAGARHLGFTLPAAGKTGTTNDFKDAWFIGFTPKLVAGVWIGFDQPRMIMRNGFASQVAVPLWATFMKAATRRDAPAWFKAPAGVTTVSVCRISGKLPTDGCAHAAVVNDNGEVECRSTVYSDYFVRGTEPTETCDVHAPRCLWERITFTCSGDRHGPDATEETSIEEILPLTSPPPVEAPVPSIPPVAAPAPSVQLPAELLPPDGSEMPKERRRFWLKLLGIITGSGAK